MNFCTTDFSKKLFLTLIVILLLSNFADFLFVERSEGWIESNISRGRSYLQLENPKTVLIGSSITSNLSRLNKDISNLSFASSSALTGLVLMKMNRNTPKLIIVDINFLFNEVSLPLLKEINGFSSIIPFSFFKVFSEKRVLFHFIKYYLLDPLTLNQPNSIDYNKPNDKSLVSFYMENFFNDDFSKEKVSENVNYFFELCEQLKQSGVSFRFFESPLDPRLFESKKNQFTRNIILQHISNDQIDMPILFKESLTYDGIHLLKASQSGLVDAINKYHFKFFN